MKKINIIIYLALMLMIITSCSKLKSETTPNTVNTPTNSTLQKGDTIPQYLGVDENNKPVISDDYKGNKIVLYFYPKDETPGCTTQACNLRDNYESLINDGYIVFGVSTDSINSHRKFILDRQLPFSLIADIDTTLIKQFGAIDNGKPTRTTFLIDENGIIVEVINPNQVDVKDHTLQILNFNK